MSSPIRISTEQGARRREHHDGRNRAKRRERPCRPRGDDSRHAGHPCRRGKQAHHEESASDGGSRPWKNKDQKAELREQGRLEAKYVPSRRTRAPG